jgi:sugar phosphate isomerase/epimerase
MSSLFTLPRREFLSSLIAAGGVTLAGSGEGVLPAGASEPPAAKRGLKLGVDNFSIRSLGWKADQILDYAANTLAVDSVLFSNLEVYESLEETYLGSLKEKADHLGISIQAGTTCICPSSETFNAKYGTAEEHLALILRVAKALGSPVARCYLGHMGDRRGEGGIYRHIENTVKVCQQVRTRALDAGVTIAIENHAGDMQAWELAELVEAAGKDYVGVTMDSGNAVWTLDEPMASLEILGPYAVATGMRDSAVWRSENGISVQWMDMGDGSVDWAAYLKRYLEICPQVTFTLEIISGGPRELATMDDNFWKEFPRARASDYAKFDRMARSGNPPTPPTGRPTGKDAEETTCLQQQFDLERSVDYCKRVLGLGLR